MSFFIASPHIRLELGIDADKLPTPASVFELHEAIHCGVDGIILAQTHVCAWMKASPPLPEDDIASSDTLPSELLES